jgi:serine/threonine protein kinase
MNNSDKIILHLCADIGSDSKPYRDAGYDVRCIGKDIGVENYHPPENVYGVIANPVCTMFSIARTCAKEPRDLEKGMFLVKECLRIIWECQYKTPLDNRTGQLKFWVLENPATGMLKAFLGKPAYIYSPHEFGEQWTKATALWGIFNPPEKPFMKFPMLPKGCSSSDIITPMTHRNKEDRMHARSICSQEFAKAFFLANQ